MCKSMKQRSPIKARNPLVLQRGLSLHQAVPSTWRHTVLPGTAVFPQQTTHGGRPPGPDQKRPGTKSQEGCLVTWVWPEGQPELETRGKGTNMHHNRVERGGWEPGGSSVLCCHQRQPVPQCDQASAVTVTPEHLCKDTLSPRPPHTPQTPHRPSQDSVAVRGGLGLPQ